ncbi:MAG TPA: hypothetical protein VL651_17035 [Bacteroidia bacterium]|nr:hypothetical protein [Bacteroidia bacterium]
MNRDNEVLFLRFITRTGMYITIQDKDNIVSFINGYEAGSRNNEFSESIKKFILEKFRVQSGSTGWPGQIQMLSEKLSLSWEVTFKRVALEFFINTTANNLQEELDQLLKTRIRTLIERINKSGDIWFNDRWVEEWLSLCCFISDWFKLLWTPEEFRIIESLDHEVSKNNIFADKESKLPTNELIKLRGEYDSLV